MIKIQSFKQWLYLCPVLSIFPQTTTLTMASDSTFEAVNQKLVHFVEEVSLSQPPKVPMLIGV